MRIPGLVVRGAAVLFAVGAAVCSGGAAARDEPSVIPVEAADRRLGLRLTSGDFVINGKRMRASVYVYRVLPEWLTFMGGPGRMVVEVQARDGTPTNLKLKSARVEQFRTRWSPRFHELTPMTGGALVPAPGQWWSAGDGPRLTPGKKASVKLEFVQGRAKKTVKLDTQVGEEWLIFPWPPESPVVPLE